MAWWFGVVFFRFGFQCANCLQIVQCFLRCLKVVGHEKILFCCSEHVKVKVEVQNVQAYVLEVGLIWDCFFSAFTIRRKKLRPGDLKQRRVCSYSKPVELRCIRRFPGFRYFLGKTTKWLAEKHRFGSGQNLI